MSDYNIGKVPPYSVIPKISAPPHGFRYNKDFISEKDHRYFLDLLSDPDFEWDPQPRRRKVKQYGYFYNYRKQSLDSDFDPIPEWLKSFLKKLVEVKIFKAEPDHIIINKYKQNGNRIWSIPPHIDSDIFFGDTIASLSLGNDCFLEFCKAHHESEEILVQHIEAKSLYIMQEKSRYEYYHRIPDAKYNKKLSLDDESNIRISITLRNLI